MKIGILTYHSVYNFGANLQVLSTFGYLKNNGFEPIVINWIPEDLEARYDLRIPSVQADAHKKFIINYLTCTDICRNESDIVQVIENQNIKGIIIGSDAVLQHNTLFSRIHLTKKGIIITPKPGTDLLFPNPFWGSFIPYLKERIPVVMMSVSSQNTNFKYITGNLKNRMNISLNQFQAITVRDHWTQKMVTYLTSGSILPSITPDPVFAFNHNIPDQLSRKQLLKKYNLNKRYLLVSFISLKTVSKEWLEKFQTIANKNELQCVALTMPEGITFEHPFPRTIELPLSPMEWYGLIKYSSGYVGENMHPIVIALHNSVPFYAFDSHGILKFKFFVDEKSSKINDILKIAGFTKNRICIKGRGYKSPSPEEVFLQIKDFDTEKCNRFSVNQQDKYNNMMRMLTTFLSDITKIETHK